MCADGDDPPHRGFWLDAEGTDGIHVLGDPDMPEESKEAIRGVARAAFKMMDEAPSTWSRMDEDELATAVERLQTNVEAEEGAVEAARRDLAIKEARLTGLHNLRREATAEQQIRKQRGARLTGE